MNYQEMLQVVDFSALYQLAFTLYAAFIAVEYAKSFTSQVINHFYDFKKEIDDKITENQELCRKEEMQSIESDDYFNSGDGLCLVDEYNTKIDECNKSAEKIKKELGNYVDNHTEYRIFRHIGIFLMLFSITFMLSGAIYRVFPSEIIHFLLSFTGVSLVVVIIGWICGAKRATQSWSEKKSIVIVGIIYAVSFALSFASMFLSFTWDNSVKEVIWTYGMIIAVILPYLNFLYFFILVTIQMSRIGKHCAVSIFPLTSEYKAAGDLMEKMLNHQEMMHKVDEHKKQEEKENGQETEQEKDKNSTT